MDNLNLVALIVLAEYLETFEEEPLIMDYDRHRRSTDPHSYTICLEALKRRKKSNTSEPEFPYGEQIGSIYPVLENILSHLPYSDLKNVSEIGVKDWEELSKSEMKKRKAATWIYVYKSNGIDLEKSANVNYESSQFVFFLYNHKYMSLGKYVCVHYEDNVIKKQTAMQYFTEEIADPANPSFLMISTPFLYPLFEKPRSTRSAFSALTIPKIANVRVALRCNRLKDDLTNFFEMTDDEKCICLLVFTTGYPHQTLDLFLMEALDGHTSNLAFCGGVTSGLRPHIYNNRITKQHFMSIGFIESGESSCKAYSIVIPDELDFEAQIVKFKENIEIFKNSILIRVTCSDKRHKSAETVILNKYFPNTPKLGMDAYGEFGWNKYNNASEDSEISSKRAKKLPTAYHGYTTVLALITWIK